MHPTIVGSEQKNNFFRQTSTPHKSNYKTLNPTNQCKQTREMKSQFYGKRVPSGIEDVIVFWDEDIGSEYVTSSRSNGFRELGHNPNCILLIPTPHFRFRGTERERKKKTQMLKWL